MWEGLPHPDRRNKWPKQGQLGVLVSNPVVGIEIEITRLVDKFKLGQNREARDLEGAAAGLDALGQHDIARAMRATRDPS